MPSRYRTGSCRASESEQEKDVLLEGGGYGAGGTRSSALSHGLRDVVVHVTTEVFADLVGRDQGWEIQSRVELVEINLWNAIVG